MNDTGLAVSREGDALEWMTLASKFLDPYDLRARLLPGLLVLLPAIVFFGLIWGPKNPWLVTLVSILTTCGGPYLLSSFVRTWGLLAQKRLYGHWGGQPSTLMLQHRSGSLARPTKLRYHALISAKLGVSLPDPEAEAANPQAADQAYEAASDALRPLVNNRVKYPLIFKELVAYGYNRNCHGSRLVGAAVALVFILATMADAGNLSVTSPFIRLQPVDTPHGLVLLISGAMLLLWLGHFTARTVELAGFAYAKRLWESLEKIPKNRR